MADGSPVSTEQRPAYIDDLLKNGTTILTAETPEELNEMLDNMIMGGKIAMLGVQGNDTKIDWNKVIFNMITIQGIYGREVFETWHKMTSMIKSGLDISKIVTAEIDYKDFEKGFELMHSGKSGKVIMNWGK